MALPPLELFSLKKEAALLPGGFFHLRLDFFACFPLTVWWCSDARSEAITTRVVAPALFAPCHLAVPGA